MNYFYRSSCVKIDDELEKSSVDDDDRLESCYTRDKEVSEP